MITIKNKEYKVKFGLRAMFIFEQIARKRFEIKTTMDEYIMFYSMLLASNKDCTLTFDEFIDELDEHPQIMVEFSAEIAKKNPLDELTAEDDNPKNVVSL